MKRELYIGIDVGHNGRKGSVFVIIDPSIPKTIKGNSVKHTVEISEDDIGLKPYEGKGDGLEAFLEKCVNYINRTIDRIFIVLESVGNYSKRYEKFYKTPGFEVWRMDSALLRKKRFSYSLRGKVKTDPRDAETLLRIFLSERAKHESPFYTLGIIDNEPIRIYKMHPFIDYEHMERCRKLLSYYHYYTKHIIYFLQQVHNLLVRIGKDIKLPPISNLATTQIKTILQIVEEYDTAESIYIKSTDITGLIKARNKIKNIIIANLKQHPDYDLLNEVFPDMFLAELIFTYWDIRQFTTFAQFVNYLGILTRHIREKSGDVIKVKKHPRMRTRIRRAFWNLFHSPKTDPKIKQIYRFYFTEFKKTNKKTAKAKALLRAGKYILKRVFVALKKREKFDINSINIEKLAIKRSKALKRKNHPKRSK